jgi:hypothetical protein
MPFNLYSPKSNFITEFILFSDRFYCERSIRIYLGPGSRLRGKNSEVK